jgi:hypothetical protein
MMEFETNVLFGAGIGGTVATHVRAKQAESGQVIRPVPGVNVWLSSRT